MRIFAPLFLFVLSFQVYAQLNLRAKLPALAKDSARVMLRVTDIGDENAGIEFATVVLLKAKDSSVVKANNTNAFGGTLFNNIGFDTYLIKVLQVGYKNYIYEPFN